jgi:uncharacterized protein YndB with AHSA1/START domain
VGESPPDRESGWTTLERDYRATLEEVWALWTTKEGIESWWGPEGFSVTVQHLDLRPGGELATEVSLAYAEVEHLRRLSYTTSTDFVPDVEPYASTTRVSFSPEPPGVHMVLSFSPMHDEEWTQRARLGHESELVRLEAILHGQP